MELIPTPQSNRTKDLFFFIFLFVLCLLGSIGIFFVAVGLENGNRIVEGAMKALLAHALWIFALFILLNIALVLLYTWQKAKSHF